MTEPSAKAVAATIDAIEAAQRDVNHPRSLARAAIAKWCSDAERLKLPVSNVHDDKGAPVLDIQRTLDHDHHNQRLGRK
jgi:hypothetical protein